MCPSGYSKGNTISSKCVLFRMTKHCEWTKNKMTKDIELLGRDEWCSMLCKMWMKSNLCCLSSMCITASLFLFRESCHLIYSGMHIIVLQLMCWLSIAVNLVKHCYSLMRQRQSWIAVLNSIKFFVQFIDNLITIEYTEHKDNVIGMGVEHVKM